MNRLTRALVVGTATLVLAGCFGSSGDVGIDVADEEAVYAVANGCFAIAVDRNENFIASPAGGGGGKPY